MPQVTITFYQEDDGSVPVRDWLVKLKQHDVDAFAKCAAKIKRLAEMGHELRRPEADYLRDGIYELRARLGNVNYRILYFFHGREASVLACALTKEDKVPGMEIERAIERKIKYEADPKMHTFIEGL